MTPNLSPLLNIKNLSKRFGGVTALEDISFSIAKNQIVSLIGPNGAGKTTLFNVVTGLYPPDSGQIFFGASHLLLNQVKPHQVIAAGIARTFQNIRLFKNLSALENVMIGAHCRSYSQLWEALSQPQWSREETKQLIEQSRYWLAFFGLTAYEEGSAKNLSYGKQRKLEIARALASKPALLLLDEPAAGMNPSEKVELLDLIRKIQAQGISILLIEHDMKFVMPISDQVIVLDYGKKIADGEPTLIQKDPKVIEAYLGQAATIEH